MVIFGGPGGSMSVYTSQYSYFLQAYQQGQHGWPVEGASDPVVRFIREFSKERPDARVLDLGCGEGRHALLFAENGFSSVGMDYQLLAIERARKIARGRGIKSGLYFVGGDLFQLPFREGVFDVVLDYGCLHHVKKSDFDLYLQAILPVMRSRCYFLLSCFSTRFRHHPGEKRTRDWLIHRGHYDRFFRKGDFRALFGRHFDIHSIVEERQSLHAFFHVLMERKVGHA